jgi:hypothetical protein
MQGRLLARGCSEAFLFSWFSVVQVSLKMWKFHFNVQKNFQKKGKKSELKDKNYWNVQMSCLFFSRSYFNLVWPIGEKKKKNQYTKMCAFYLETFTRLLGQFDVRVTLVRIQYPKLILTQNCWKEAKRKKFEQSILKKLVINHDLFSQRGNNPLKKSRKVENRNFCSARTKWR